VLKRRGLSISPAGVRCVWQRHDLTSMKLRLKALEAKVAQDGILLTETQIAALEKAKTDKEAHGEFESAVPRLLRCPGHLLRRHAEGCGASLSDNPRPPKDRAARLGASARSTGGFNRLRGRDARFAVAQDARGGDPSLATTWNPVNFRLRASGRKALLASTTWSGRIQSGSTRRDRDPHFNSAACGLGHIFAGEQDDLTAA